MYLQTKGTKGGLGMFNALEVLIISFSFLRPKENIDPYGISCLITAFRKSPVIHPDDRICSYVIDLNTEQNSAVIVYQMIETIRQSKCNILALSNFIWADRYISIALPVIRKEFPNLKIMMGGPMVQGDETSLKAKYPEVDVFTVSYGEAVFSDLRTVLDSGKCRIELPPKFSELESPYLMKQIELEKGMTVRMETRRGCPFNCSYCRHRNANGCVHKIGTDKKVRSELELFTEKKVSKINVLDPFLNDINNRDMSKAHGIRFLKTCKEVGVDAEISVQIRPEMINQTYLETVNQMNNVTFEIGIQSLDKDVYPYINRGNEKAQALVMDRLREVVRHDINTEITLIYGLPNQTYESFENDINTLKKLGFKDIKAFPLQIYPATEILNTYSDFGLKVKNVEPFGIMEVYDNPSHDFEQMNKLAGEL